MLREARQEFASVLEEALATEGWPKASLALEEPPSDVDSIVASSVAFKIANEADLPPPVVAERLVEAIDISDCRYVGAVQTQGPYLNALPSNAYYRDTVLDAGAAEFGTLPDRNESMVVEHTSANPTGPIHVGRARNPILGDALARVLDAAGYDVDVHYYVNDAGRQMALFTWAYETFDESDLTEEPDRDRIEYDLVRYYRAGNAFLEEAPEDEVEEAEAEITNIMQGLEKGDEETYERVSAVVDQVLEGMKTCLERLPATFDEFVKETRFMFDGSTADLVERIQALDEAIYEDEAWQLDLSDHGIDKNLVFLRSDGTSLYPTRDIAHHEWKFEKYDRAVTVLGEDHKLQADQLRTTLELLGNDTGQLDQVVYSYVNLPEGKMSTRRGTGVDLDDLLDEAISRARDEVERRMDDRIRAGDLTDDQIDRIAHQVGIGAVRYDIVGKQPTKAITFEWDHALDFEAQSAPFVQYVHARCCGILEQVDAVGEPDTELEVQTPSGLHESERALIEIIATYPYIIEKAASDRAPHRIASYLQDLADTFNSFYRDCPVLDADEDDKALRIALVRATRQTVAGGLDLLGIDAPEVM